MCFCLLQYFQGFAVNIFCHVPRENWIVDRMATEYQQFSRHNVNFQSINEKTNLIWLLGSWCWNQIPFEILKNLPVVCTVHHEVPSKFDESRKNNFLIRDSFVDRYLTYTKETKDFIENLSTKKVDIIPHWVNTNIWNQIDKQESRKILGLPKEKFIIGSFQRDTEGFDLKTPKLEKGPDIFVDKVLEISKIKNVHVLLGGWRRQYVIRRLEENNIPYTYIELADLNKLNKMYRSLDLYIVSSRCEGGPQAIFECAYMNVPILSTRVGQYEFLSKECLYEHIEKIDDKKINNAQNSCEENYRNISDLFDHKHIKKYDDYFGDLII